MNTAEMSILSENIIYTPQQVGSVGSIPIVKPQNFQTPPQGNQLELEGIIQNGIFTVIKMESEEDEEGKVEIKGVLVRVDRSEKSIVIEIAGNRFTVSISQALIMDEDGHPLTLSDLESLVGEDLEIEGVYLKNGLSYAKKVYVDVEQEEDAKKDEEEHEEDGGGQRG